MVSLCLGLQSYHACQALGIFRLTTDSEHLFGLKMHTWHVQKSAEAFLLSIANDTSELRTHGTAALYSVSLCKRQFI